MIEFIRTFNRMDGIGKFLFILNVAFVFVNLALLAVPGLQLLNIVAAAFNVFAAGFLYNAFKDEDYA